MDEGTKQQYRDEMQAIYAKTQAALVEAERKIMQREKLQSWRCVRNTGCRFFSRLMNCDPATARASWFGDQCSR